MREARTLNFEPGTLNNHFPREEVTYETV